MQMLLGTAFVCLVALMFGFLLHKQQKIMLSNRRIERKLDKLITQLAEENNDK